MTTKNESKLNVFTETKLEKSDNDHNFDTTMRSGTYTPHVVLEKIKNHRRKKRKLRKNKSIAVTSSIRSSNFSKKPSKFSQFNMTKSKCFLCE